MHRAHRPKNDGIIDEVAISRTFLGDAEAGARLTPEEREEVLRRASARYAEEAATRDSQRYLLRQAYPVSIGPDTLDITWKSLLSKGLGLHERIGTSKRFDSLFQAILRQRRRDAAAA